MSNVVLEVRFTKTGKPVFVSPLKYNFKIGDLIITNSEKGQEIARVVKILSSNNIPQNAKIEDIIRPASKKDMLVQQDNEKKAKQAVAFCKNQALKLGLKMKVLMADYTLDKSKLTIYFSAEGRVDFRELVRVLAAEYRVRIELRQIGPRDEMKNYCSVGMCGRDLCCRTFLQDFDPITIKMAKDQGLQINMSKLSGVCGRLKCCLKYEYELYKENLKKLPKIGDIVEIKDKNEKGKVIDLDVLNLKVNLKLGKPDVDERFESYPIDQIVFKPSKGNIANKNPQINKKKFDK